MSIEIPGYTATCDECDCELFPDLLDVTTILKMMLENGWVVYNGKVLCDRCYREYLNNA